MGFWPLLLIAFLGTFLAGLFLSPLFLSFIKRNWARLKKHTPISKRKRKEIETIRSMALVLALIAPLPYNPGELTTQDIRDFLLDMRSKAKKLKSKELRGIKEKLISFSENEIKIKENMDLLETQAILGRENIFKLSEDIWQAIGDIKKEKKK